MKKILYCFLTIIFIFLLCGCDKEYTGKKIISIEYQKINHTTGYSNYEKMDLINHKVYSKVFLHEINNDIEYKEKYQLDQEKEIEFINEINKIGLLNLKYKYESNLSFFEKTEWNFIITYEDGTTKVSTGTNSSLRNKFKKADNEFYVLFNNTFFGLTDKMSSYPPTLSITYHEKETNRRISYIGVSITNYTWESKTINNIDNIQYAKENQDHEFKQNYQYQCVLYTANTEKRFNKMTLKEYDLNGNLIDTIFTKKWFTQIEFDLTLDRIYVAETQFRQGTVEYVFSTIYETLNRLPDNFSFELYSNNIESKNTVFSYNSKTKILSNENNSIIYEISNDDLLDIYKYMYNRNFLEMEKYYKINSNESSQNKNIGLNYYFRGMGRGITLGNVYFNDDIDESNEGKKALEIINYIYNKYFKEKYESINKEPYPILMNKPYTNDKMYVKFLNEDKCEFSYLNELYNCNYYIHKGQICISIGYSKEDIKFYIGESCLIFKEYSGLLFEMDNIKPGTKLNHISINN